MKKTVAAVCATVVCAAAVLAWAHRPHQPLPADVQADKVVVRKAERAMRLYRGGKILREYRIALGANPAGHKQQEGDERTPEGNYILDQANPKSIAFLSLHVSYPDALDIRTARKRGISPGGMIMVHGILNGFGWMGRLHRLIDWTNGCIAITNQEMQEFWNAVPVGTPIEIRP